MMARETKVNLIILAALGLLPVLAHWAGEGFWVTLATRMVILGMAGVGLNLALGLGGLVSLGHAVFFGLGGYAMGILAFHAQDGSPVMSWPITLAGTQFMPLIWLVAMVVAGLVAWVIGVLSLRTSGAYFIMITLAFGQMFYFFMISWPGYGGEDGLSIYMRNRFPGINTLAPLPFFLLCYALLLMVLGFFAVLARSGFGLALNATRQNPMRVQAVGARPDGLLLLAFVISGMITALAGALFADLNRFVSPVMFSWHTSGEIMVLVILGGVGRLCGPVVGACLFILMEHLLGGLSEHWALFLGFVLLVVVLFARGGVMGLLVREGERHG